MELQLLENKLENLLQTRKKIQALANFSQTFKYFKDWAGVQFLLLWMERNTEYCSEVENLADAMLKKYAVYYLDWQSQTKWVKRQIRSRRTYHLKIKQLELF